MKYSLFMIEANENTSTSMPRRHRPVFDRGDRPFMRGRLHSAAAWYFGGSASALTAVTAYVSGFSLLLIVTAIYSLALVGMLLVSALYHRAPWRSEKVVQGWRRADHATIAVFIAATYGPVTIAAFGSDFWASDGWFAWGGTWILLVSWIAASAAVFLNVIWIDHPRWLGSMVYLALGWVAIWAVRGFYINLGVAPSLLILIGGLIYTAGALIYAKKWPNPSERWFGFHEVFHAATIVAALLHHITIWILVLR